MEKQNKDIRCACGKLVAIEKNGVIYVYCKGCKRQVPIYREPRANEPRAVEK